MRRKLLLAGLGLTFSICAPWEPFTPGSNIGYVARYDPVRDAFDALAVERKGEGDRPGDLRGTRRGAGCSGG